jgi:oligopeptide/dipeptide ABC transporter ATP-binding protein
MKILSAQNVKKYFPIKKGVFLKTVGHVKALEDVSLDINENETVGIVGESGCGKSTLGRLLTQIHKPTDGKVLFYENDENNGHCINTSITKEAALSYKKNVQMIFQNPFDSLNPRKTVGDIIREPLRIHRVFKDKKEERQYVNDLLLKVGLYEEYFQRYPHEFSGGQRQRIAIARSIALKPKLVICDEPTSALDVSVQSQVINLLKDIQKENNIAYIFISHNLDVVHNVSDKIMVLYLGNMVEFSDANELFENPLHPYTKALMGSMPSWSPKDRKLGKVKLIGEPPSPINPPSGCPFHTRCSKRKPICDKIKPKVCDIDGHKVACHLYR